MNKTEFLKAIAEKAGTTNKDTSAMYDAMLEVIAETLKNDDKIQLVGFGTFELKKKAAREGLNPATKEKIQIPASNAPTFKAGKAFKDMFN